MSILPKITSTYFATDSSKQTKFFNDIFSKNQVASLATLLSWSQPTKQIPFISLLIPYSAYGIVHKFFKLLNSSFFNILLIYLASFRVGFSWNLVSLVSYWLKRHYFPIYSNSVSAMNSLMPNVTLLSWFDVNKQLFNSNFLTLTFKTTKRNLFLLVSSASGLVLWKKSSGIVGFKGKHKKAPEALKKLVDALVVFLRNCNVPSSFIFRFFFIKSLDKNKIDSLTTLLNRVEFYYTYIIYDVRQPHGYMRLRKQRRL